MPTNNETTKVWLQNALLQLGAESYLHGIDYSVKDDVISRLKFGFNDPTHSYILGIAGNWGQAWLIA